MNEKSVLPYAAVETALARTFGVDATGQRTWLRARIQHLRKLGLTAGQPGKGKTIGYSRDHATKWLVALALAHIGFDPAKAVELIKALWTSRPPRRHEIPIAPQETISYLVERARTAGPHVHILIRFGPIGTAPVFGHTTDPTVALGELHQPSPVDGTVPRAVCSIDLTHIVQKFDAALDEAQAVEEASDARIA